MKKISVVLISIVLIFGVFIFVKKDIKSPFFSIIVSSYNYGHYVGQTIESVLQQTYPHFELILVNDGSEDNTLDVITTYAKQDKRIKVIDQKNQGLSIARNNAIRIASGDYLWFVDADDYIKNDALEILKKKIDESDNPDIVSFYIQPVHKDGSIRTTHGYAKLPQELLTKKYNVFHGRELPFHILASYPVTSGKQIYKKSFIDKHRIRFIPRLVFEDDVFFLTVLMANAKGTALSDKLYIKRFHDKSIIANRPKHYSSVVKLPKYIYREVKRVGASEETAEKLFSIYFGSIFSKYPNNKKYLNDLKKMSDWLKKQPQNKFWQEKTKQISDFIKTQSD